MKTNRLLFLLLAVLFVTVGASSVFAQEKKSKNKESAVFLVEGMHCKNCQATIEKYIAFEKGVADIKCDLESKLVTVTYDSKKTNPEKLLKGFEKIKFPAVIVPPEADSEQNK